MTIRRKVIPLQMRLWRLSSERRARDFDGGYGLSNDGRWNSRGRPVPIVQPALR
jgi:RES domain-containing protein